MNSMRETPLSRSNTTHAFGADGKPHSFPPMEDGLD